MADQDDNQERREAMRAARQERAEHARDFTRELRASLRLIRLGREIERREREATR